MLTTTCQHMLGQLTKGFTQQKSNQTESINQPMNS